MLIFVKKTDLFDIFCPGIQIQIRHSGPIYKVSSPRDSPPRQGNFYTERLYVKT